MNAKEFLSVALGGNMNVGTLKPLAIEEIMEAYAKYHYTPDIPPSAELNCYEAKFRKLLTATRRFKLAAEAYNIETIKEGGDIDLIVDELMESRAALFNLAEQAA